MNILDIPESDLELFELCDEVVDEGALREKIEMLFSVLSALENGRKRLRAHQKKESYDIGIAKTKNEIQFSLLALKFLTFERNFRAIILHSSVSNALAN